MTEKKLEELFRTWQHRLGLDLWNIRIQIRENDPPTNAMECGQSLNYEAAVIYVQPWVLTGTPPADWHGGDDSISDEEVEKCVVHELLHCSFKRMKLWQEQVRDQVHRDVWAAVWEANNQSEEATIEALAVALVRAWPKEAK